MVSVGQLDSELISSLKATRSGPTRPQSALQLPGTEDHAGEADGGCSLPLPVLGASGAGPPDVPMWDDPEDEALAAKGSGSDDDCSGATSPGPAGGRKERQPPDRPEDRPGSSLCGGSGGGGGSDLRGDGTCSSLPEAPPSYGGCQGRHSAATALPLWTPAAAQADAAHLDDVGGTAKDVGGEDSCRFVGGDAAMSSDGFQAEPAESKCMSGSRGACAGPGGVEGWPVGCCQASNLGAEGSGERAGSGSGEESQQRPSSASGAHETGSEAGASRREGGGKEEAEEAMGEGRGDRARGRSPAPGCCRAVPPPAKRRRLWPLPRSQGTSGARAAVVDEGKAATGGDALEVQGGCGGSTESGRNAAARRESPRGGDGSTGIMAAAATATASGDDAVTKRAVVAAEVEGPPAASLSTAPAEPASRSEYKGSGACASGGSDALMMTGDSGDHAGSAPCAAAAASSSPPGPPPQTPPPPQAPQSPRLPPAEPGSGSYDRCSESPAARSGDDGDGDGPGGPPPRSPAQSPSRGLSLRRCDGAESPRLPPSEGRQTSPPPYPQRPSPPLSPHQQHLHLQEVVAPGADGPTPAGAGGLAGGTAAGAGLAVSLLLPQGGRTPACPAIASPQPRHEPPPRAAPAPAGGSPAGNPPGWRSTQTAAPLPAASAMCLSTAMPAQHHYWGLQRPQSQPHQEGPAAAPGYGSAGPPTCSSGVGACPYCVGAPPPPPPVRPPASCASFASSACRCSRCCGRLPPSPPLSPPGGASYPSSANSGGGYSTVCGGRGGAPGPPRSHPQGPSATYEAGTGIPSTHWDRGDGQSGSGGGGGAGAGAASNLTGPWVGSSAWGPLGPSVVAWNRTAAWSCPPSRAGGDIGTTGGAGRTSLVGASQPLTTRQSQPVAMPPTPGRQGGEHAGGMPPPLPPAQPVLIPRGRDSRSAALTEGAAMSGDPRCPLGGPDSPRALLAFSSWREPPATGGGGCAPLPPPPPSHFPPPTAATAAFVAPEQVMPYLAGAPRGAPAPQHQPPFRPYSSCPLCLQAVLQQRQQQQHPPLRRPAHPPSAHSYHCPPPPPPLSLSRSTSLSAQLLSPSTSPSASVQPQAASPVLQSPVTPSPRAAAPLGAREEAVESAAVGGRNEGPPIGRLLSARRSVEDDYVAAAQRKVLPQQQHHQQRQLEQDLAARPQQQDLAARPQQQWPRPQHPQSPHPQPQHSQPQIQQAIAGGPGMPRHQQQQQQQQGELMRGSEQAAVPPPYYPPPGQWLPPPSPSCRPRQALPAAAAAAGHLTSPPEPPPPSLAPLAGTPGPPSRIPRTCTVAAAGPLRPVTGAGYDCSYGYPVAPAWGPCPRPGAPPSTSTAPASGPWCQPPCRPVTSPPCCPQSSPQQLRWSQSPLTAPAAATPPPPPPPPSTQAAAQAAAAAASLPARSLRPADRAEALSALRMASAPRVLLPEWPTGRPGGVVAGTSVPPGKCGCPHFSRGQVAGLTRSVSWSAAASSVAALYSKPAPALYYTPAPPSSLMSAPSFQGTSHSPLGMPEQPPQPRLPHSPSG